MLERIRELENQLEEASETLRAFTGDEVDAIVAPGADGDRVYTLKGADETYRIMVQEMAEGALTLTPGGLILFSNQQFATMLQCPLERVIGASLLDFVVADDAGIAATLLSGTDGRKAEVRLSQGGTAVVPAYLSLQNVILDGAECYCLTVTDLSAQKRHEEIAAVTEAVPVGVFISEDAEGRSVRGNRRAYEMLRMPAGASIASSVSGELPRGWREMRGGKDIPAGELPMQVAARSGQPVHDYEFEIEFDDGTSRCWLGNAVPLFDEARQTRGAVGAFMDITDRKRAEDTLAAANTELRSFIHALAHGLQEPLRNMLDWTQLLTEESAGRLSEEANRHLSDSVVSALKMESLLNELLHYWNVTERGAEKLTPVDFNGVLSQVRENMSEQIRTSHAVLTSDTLPTVVADEVMLVEVFENLISNSIKYRGNAAPKIHISAVRAGERWLFTVRDNGVGIDHADAERVFGMFSSLQGTGSSGTGIGLALCRKVVERHGGRIWLESVPGQGSAFRFTIPIYLDTVLPGVADPAGLKAAGAR